MNECDQIILNIEYTINQSENYLDYYSNSMQNAENWGRKTTHKLQLLFNT